MSSVEITLEEFGLTPNETRIYLTCLKEDDLSPFKLAKLTNIPRTTIYEILMSLSLKGLVKLEQSDGFTKQQTRVKANNPSVLRDIIWEKKRRLSDLDVDIVDLLPTLQNDYHKEKSNAEFQFFPGIEGAKKVYFKEYIVDGHIPIYAFDNLMPMDVFGKKETNEDVARSLKHLNNEHIEINEIFALNDWTKHVLGYQMGRDKDYVVKRRMRFIENPAFFINQRIVLYGEHIRITTAKDNEVWGLIIKSKSLSNTFHSLFHFVWSLAEPLTPKLVVSWGKNEFLESEKRKKSSPPQRL